MSYFRTQLLSDLESGFDGKEISASTRAYFQQRFRNRVYQFLLGKFLAAEKHGLTKAKLARRINKSPEVINRWLGSPSNIGSDSMSDLLLGISGEEIVLTSQSPLEYPRTNYSLLSEMREPITNSVTTKAKDAVDSAKSKKAHSMIVLS